jgi:hypothetical protein
MAQLAADSAGEGVAVAEAARRILEDNGVTPMQSGVKRKRQCWCSITFSRILRFQVIISLKAILLSHACRVQSCPTSQHSIALLRPQRRNKFSFADSSPAPDMIILGSAELARVSSSHRKARHKHSHASMLRIVNVSGSMRGRRLNN